MNGCIPVIQADAGYFGRTTFVSSAIGKTAFVSSGMQPSPTAAPLHLREIT